MMDVKQFVLKSRSNGLNKTKIYSIIRKKYKYNKSLRTFQRQIKKWEEEIDIIENSKDINDIIVLEASNQNLRDKNRIANKKIRQIARLSNSSNELFQKILTKLKKMGLVISVANNKVPLANKVKPGKQKEAIVQLSDLHLNSNVLLSDTLGINEYGYEKGSQRLYDFAQRIKETLGESVSNITVALTGDLLNSDRRIDEMLSNSDCRSEAMLKAVQILSGFLLDLNSCYQVQVVSVVGNESRIDKDMPIRDPLHNYDFLIHAFLANFLKNSGIKFLNMERTYDKVVNVCGANILLTHNYFNISWDKAVMKYNEVGISLDYMITGHKHETEITHHTAQAGSIVGTDFYGINKLNKITKASANLYILEKNLVDKKPCIDVICFDLQRTKYNGKYDCTKDATITEE